LLSVADIRHIKRNAQSLKAHAQAFDVDLTFVTASTVGLKDAEYWALDAPHIIALHVQRWNQSRQTVILTSSRYGIDDFVLQSFLSLCALGVDDWSFACDGDRLLQTANAQLSVNIRSECSGQLNTVSDDTSEAGQCECHRVGTGPQIDDSIASSFICHRGTNLFNQYRTLRLYRYARQHRPGAISDDTS